MHLPRESAASRAGGRRSGNFTGRVRGGHLDLNRWMLTRRFGHRRPMSPELEVKLPFANLPDLRLVDYCCCSCSFTNRNLQDHNRYTPLYLLRLRPIAVLPHIYGAGYILTTM